ncbi:BREX-1 system adenine-specific DNA-methyltransferase PglX, partial [Mycobacteroides abscessus subsp. abscessus]
VHQMDYYIAPIEEEAEFLKIARPEELKVIDPACGSGHMLTYAFDLLYAIYEEEGYAPSEIPGLILTNNLYGTEIDARAGALAAFALTMKAVARRKPFLKNPVRPNVCVIEPISFGPHELEFLVTSDGDSDREKSFWNQFAEANNFGSLIQPDPDLVLRLTQFIETLDDGGDLLRADSLERASHVLAQAKYLSERYHVAIANPPYLGSKKLSNKMSEWLKTSYPRSYSDLYAAFIDRATTFACAGGSIAMVTMHSWMFLSTSRQLRSHILTTTTTDILVHLGTKAFDTMSGEIVSTVAFISTMRPSRTRSGLYIRLNGHDTAAEKRDSLLRISRNGVDENCYLRSSAMFLPLPGSRLMYWLSQDARDILAGSSALETAAPAIQGMITGSNDRFLRLWHEVSFDAIESDGEHGWGASKRWAPYNKGGDSRRWYGSQSHIVNWSNGGRDFVRNRSTNSQFYFREYLSWSYRSSDEFAPRYYPSGFLWDVAGSGVFPNSHRTLVALLALLGSTTGSYLMNCLNPTSTFQVENVLEMPVVAGLEDDVYSTGLDKEVLRAIDISRRDWDQYETSWNFRVSPLICREGPLSSRLDDLYVSHRQSVDDLTRSEAALDAFFATRYSIGEALSSAVSPPRRATLAANYFDSSDSSNVGRINEFRSDTIEALASFAIGCMFGRYSLDEPGLILANRDSTLQDYLARVPSPTFMPDNDNVIPIVDGDWFEDDIVGRFRHFLRVAFGEKHFEENLNFIAEALGVRNLREYFITKAGRSKFYDDHVQRYKKRPIYWLFSSPKGSFNALIYLHRYTPSTASTVLTYLREYVTKLESSLQQAERAGVAKEADRLRKILVELNEYEHDTLYPKASENVVIALDDGVKVNYPKLGGALRKIAGLESSSD